MSSNSKQQLNQSKRFNERLLNLIKYNEIEDAIQLFEQSDAKPTIYTISIMLNLYARFSLLTKGIELFKEYTHDKSINKLNVVLITSYLRLCSSSYCYKLLKEGYEYIKYALINHYPQLVNSRSVDTLLRGCLKIGNIDIPLKLFNLIKKYNINACSSFSLRYLLEIMNFNLEIDKSWFILYLIIDSENNDNILVCILGLAMASVIVNDKESIKNACNIYEKLTNTTIDNKDSNVSLSHRRFNRVRNQEQKDIYQMIISNCTKLTHTAFHYQFHPGFTNVPNIFFLSPYPSSDKSAIKLASLVKSSFSTIELCIGSGNSILDRDAHTSEILIANEIRFDRCFTLIFYLLINNISNVYLFIGDVAEFVKILRPIDTLLLNSININYPEPNIYNYINKSFVEDIKCILKNSHTLSNDQTEFNVVTDDQNYAKYLSHLFGEILYSDVPYKLLTSFSSSSSYFNKFFNEANKKKRYILQYFAEKESSTNILENDISLSELPYFSNDEVKVGTQVIPSFDGKVVSFK